MKNIGLGLAIFFLFVSSCYVPFTNYTQVRLAQIILKWSRGKKSLKKSRSKTKSPYLLYRNLFEGHLTEDDSSLTASWQVFGPGTSWIPIQTNLCYRENVFGPSCCGMETLGCILAVCELVIKFKASYTSSLRLRFVKDNTGQVHATSDSFPL